jgi:hypothetical protein
MHYSPIFTTDQRLCYNENGKPIACHGTGQDGDSRLRRPWPHPRFAVDGPVVRDDLTGLVWPRNASLSPFPLSWPEAHDFVESLNRDFFAKRNDWRLPARRELFSLVSHAHVNPALPGGHPFSDVFHGYYWTATACSRLPNQAWYVHMGGGRMFKGMQHGSYMVWPVSGTATDFLPPEPRFEMEAAALVDRMTAAMWPRRADMTDGRTVSWSGALAAVRKLNDTGTYGFRDWRLPNVRELESLVDPLRHSPALWQASVFSGVQEGYWSATTSVFDPSYAWVLYTVDGAVGVGYKPKAEFFVWPVRTI